ncbi:hypothetical protein VaNZ11_011495 [Volvox africanus]|uniref:Uncharacterized protein n=1 Tax=Volvox africanus TaxID=51714 RepID=A0ABQ5SD01_9CHLO|nr:hypothetical protein VaNZ11_011495 [Volvox africanus]
MEASSASEAASVPPPVAAPPLPGREIRNGARLRRPPPPGAITDIVIRGSCRPNLRRVGKVDTVPSGGPESTSSAGGFRSNGDRMHARGEAWPRTPPLLVAICSWELWCRWCNRSGLPYSAPPGGDTDSGGGSGASSDAEACDGDMGGEAKRHSASRPEEGCSSREASSMGCSKGISGTGEHSSASPGSVAAATPAVASTIRSSPLPSRLLRCE